MAKLKRLRDKICMNENFHILGGLMSLVDDEMISEDETDNEYSRPGLKVFRRIERSWVNPQITCILHNLLDVHLHRLDNFGELGAGNQFRQRINHPPVRVTDGNVVVGLPRNFYHPGWLAGLSQRERDELRYRPDTDLTPILTQLPR